jgi:GH15 family glucan-1,4-alpha-glucosidase
MDRPGLRFPAVRLVERSLEVLLENQAPSGAFIASPNFPSYAFCWFRDGAYIAYALDLYGEHASAARFHAWAAAVLNRRAAVVPRALHKAAAGQPLGNDDILHTRYTLTGEPDPQDDWPNFQLDGLGAWLWSLAAHQRLVGGPLPADWRRAAGLAAGYLAGLWRLPCYDCWEEFPSQVHPHTLAAIYGGLRAYSDLTSSISSETSKNTDEVVFLDVYTEIRSFLLENALLDGRWQKFLGNPQVDASLLGLSTPYRVVDPNDPSMRRTVEKIEADLVRGGVYRYAADTYYGGGQWLLLAAWLGWYWCEAGQPGKARLLRSWIEAQADERGWLPEQVPILLIDPSFYEPWLQRWGPVANPLLWSHAQYLILCWTLERYC